jgi:electron transfer flavoprotein alpha subunit
MKKEPLAAPVKGIVKVIDTQDIIKTEDFIVEIIERHIEERKIDIKGSPIIIAGGFGVGSRENFNLLYELASVLGAEVGASRAAVDAGFAEGAR